MFILNIVLCFHAYPGLFFSIEQNYSTENILEFAEPKSFHYVDSNFFLSSIFLGAGGAEGNYRLMDYAGSRVRQLKKTRGLLHVCRVEKALGWSSAGEAPNKDYSDLILAALSF